ncbi:unnamed protein product [Closterium sp. NIES-53]
MTSLRRSGGSGAGGGGSSGNGGDRPSSRCGEVRWGVSDGGQMQFQQRQRESLPPQQLREWYTSRGGGGGSSGSHYAAVQLGVPYATSAASARDPYASATSSLLELVTLGVDIFALDYDAILTAMYALSASAEGDCYRCVPPDPGIEAAALGAGESSLLGTAPAEALHTFTLDSSASRCFFRDSTTLTPLPAPVPIRLYRCPPGCDGHYHHYWGSEGVDLHVHMDGASPGHVHSRPGSSLYTLATEPLYVAASALVSASGQVAASCSCRLLSHQTFLWHHRLGHPSLPTLRGMHSRLLVSGLPRSLPPLPTSPAPPCLPCVEGRQRATPHSSFPPTTAPLQTLHMDV